MIRTQDLFDPKAVARLFGRRKWLLLVPMVFVTGIALAGSYVISPVYESTIIVWVGNPVRLSTDVYRMLGEFRDDLGTTGDRSGELRDLKRELISVPYLSQVIEKLHLADDPELETQARAMSATQPELTMDELKTGILANQIAENIDVEYVGKTHLKISVRAGNPQKARELAQTLGAVFVEEKAREELGSIFLSLNFSYEQLARYEKELQAKIAARTALEKEITEGRPGDVVQSEENRKAIGSEIEKRSQEIDDLRTVERTAAARLERLAKSDFKVQRSRQLDDLSGQLRDIVESVSGLIQKHTWDDPAIGNQSIKAVKIEDEVNAEQERLVNVQFPNLEESSKFNLVTLLNARERLGILTRYVEVLKEGIAQLDKKIGSLPEYRTKIEQLDGEVKALERLRDRFKEQQESFVVSQALVEESRYKVVENARTNLTPVWPSRILIVAFGLVIGLFLGGGAVLLVEYSDRSFREVDEVEEILDIQVLGVLPKVENIGKVFTQA